MKHCFSWKKKSLNNYASNFNQQQNNQNQQNYSNHQYQQQSYHKNQSITSQHQNYSLSESWKLINLISISIKNYNTNICYKTFKERIWKLESKLIIMMDLCFVKSFKKVIFDNLKWNLEQ
jgi:hypothetical protein